jgi:GNAT superfamily N-acetyltransferase
MEHSQKVTLQDGSTVRIELLSAGRLEARGDTASECELALIATIGQAPNETQVGMSSYSADTSRKESEIAIRVAGDWQGKGLERALLRPLLAHACRQNMSRLVSAEIEIDVRKRRVLVDELGFDSQADPRDPRRTLFSLDLI